MSVTGVTVSAWIYANSVGDGFTHSGDTVVQRYNTATPWLWKLGVYMDPNWKVKKWNKLTKKIISFFINNFWI